MMKFVCYSGAARAAWIDILRSVGIELRHSGSAHGLRRAPDPDSITSQMRENMDDELTEVKSENTIDRITSQANPRTLERVPAGARFHFRMVLDVLCPEDRELFPRLLEGLRLLEDDSLGGGGSRGKRTRGFVRTEAGVARAQLLRLRRGRTGLMAGADLAGSQSLANAPDFAEKLAE